MGNELVEKAMVLRSLKTWQMTPICCVTVSSLVTSPDQIGTAALYSAVWVFIIYSLLLSSHILKRNGFIKARSDLIC